MQTSEWILARLPALVKTLAPCRHCPAVNTEKRGNLPGRQAVIGVLDNLIAILYPGCHGHEPLSHAGLAEDIHARLAETARQLDDQCRRALAYQCEFEQCRDCGDCREQSARAVQSLFDALPAIRTMLYEDIRAAFEGDPAARSTLEVVMSYPGIYAITVQRLAHALYRQSIPLIPRVMGEHAHSMTGIDIHPGARIGPGFFIDHGTGVVIGETCTIGCRVKIYQGVTLGALSFAKDTDGRLIKGIQRHPTVEDDVVLYAGATILGGETTIGHHAVIGGNVWLTHSVPPHAKVYNRQPAPRIRRGDVPQTGRATEPAP